MSRINFSLSSAEHDKRSITLGPGGLPMDRVARITDRPNVPLAVDHGYKELNHTTLSINYACHMMLQQSAL